MLKPHEVKGVDHDAVCIADGNKVSRILAEAGDHPDAPHNLDAADDAADASINGAKEATPQRDNRSAAEETALYKSLLEAANDFPSAACVSGSVVGNHFGSGQVV